MRHVAAADANREFSKILRDVRSGESVIVTSRGEPVAVIVPAKSTPSPVREKAVERLLSRLKGQPPAGISWQRDELYDDQPK